MSLDQVLDQSEPHLNPAAARVAVPREIVAFKFGGTSLLGAERMLHAANLVRQASQSSRVVAIVSAMKGMTDHLLGVSESLAAGKQELARKQAERVIDLHMDVLGRLQLDETAELGVARNLQSLGRDLLHEVPASLRCVASAELSDRLGSYGERFSARLFAAALEKSGVPPSLSVLRNLCSLATRSAMQSRTLSKPASAAAMFFFPF